MPDARTRRIIEPVAAATPEIGRWLWALEDTRRRTMAGLARLAPATLDWAPPDGSNSISTLLYHIALIEADYLYADVLEQATYPEDIMALFPVADRDADGTLATPPAVGIEEHRHRLDVVRGQVMTVFGGMTAEDFRRQRTLPQYTITPEWTLHHLMQHEAEHRGQITALRDYAEGRNHG